MSVYVDNMNAAFGRMKMCHMIADSTNELDGMADHIGVSRQWCQFRGTYKEHYDINLGKRAVAIAAGAKEVTLWELAQMVVARRKGMK